MTHRKSKPKGYWRSIDNLKLEASKYKTRIEFKKGNSPAYKSAIALGVLEVVCSDIDKRLVDWSEDLIIAEASKYLMRGDFKSESPLAYSAAVRRGILNRVCSHMGSKKINWTLESLASEAMKYKTRSDFWFGNRRAYWTAEQRGIIDIICSHMEFGKTGFNPCKPAAFYYLRIDGCMDCVLYKIGVTNRSVSSRIKGMIVPAQLTVTVVNEVKFSDGEDAKKLENKIKKEFADFKYAGAPILGNGNTELFVKDILNLDSLMEAA